MPRDARKVSESGIYHAIVRGVSHQRIFEEDGDYVYFLNKMDKCAADTRICVWAYTLMDNHVHLLLCDKERQLDRFMKKLGTGYVQYFNKKYQRSGHLFQDRFKSEPVNDDDYLLTVYRYILRNPDKAGIASAKEYRWNSYSDYLGEPRHSDPSLLKEMIGDAGAFEAFISAEDDRLCMEYEPIGKDDASASWLIRRMISAASPTALQAYGKSERDQILRKLKEEGLTIRQIERLTGIGRGVILKA